MDVLLLGCVFLFCGALGWLYWVLIRNGFGRKLGDHRSSVKFPEHLFRADARPADEVRRAVNQGLTTMRRTNIVMVGLVHNLGSILDLTLRRWVWLGRHFHRFHIVLFENNSTDGTGAVLDRWRDHPHVTVLQKHFPNRDKGAIVHGEHAVTRFQHMAEYRQQLVDHVRTHWSHFDHVLVADCDLEVGLSVNGVAEVFSHPADTWDFQAANGLSMKSGRYYDPLAFQTADGQRVKRHPKRASGSEQWRHLRFNKGTNLVPVKSAFAGACVYRMNAFLAGRYTGEDCEHVTFHHSLFGQGFRKGFLNPSFIVVR